MKYVYALSLVLLIMNYAALTFYMLVSKESVSFYFASMLCIGAACGILQNYETYGADLSSLSIERLIWLIICATALIFCFAVFWISRNGSESDRKYMEREVKKIEQGW